MILRLRDTLNPGDVEVLSTGSAGGATRLIEALEAQPLFELAVLPRRFGPLSLSSTLARSDERPGHVRPDLEVIVFLSDPAGYEGGELTIDTGYGDEYYKEAAGTCVVCPLPARRATRAVSRGERRLATMVVESRVRDSAQREILYDLGCALGYYELGMGATEETSISLRRTRDALLHEWADI
jgi:PKHD-type hydroxylase